MPPLAVQALFELERLRTIVREGWRHRGVAQEDLENDFEHTARVNFHTLILPTKKTVNRVKAGAMAQLHDLDELVLGDEMRQSEIRLPLDEDPRLRSIAEEIEEAEFSSTNARLRKLLAFEIVVNGWPSQAKEEALKLYIDYTYAQSVEAKLVHQAHLVADLTRGLMYIAGECPSGTKYRDIDLDTFWRDAQAAQVWSGAPVDLEPILESMRQEEEILRADK